MAVSDRQVKQGNAKDLDYKLNDENGVYRRVKKNASKYWRFKYRLDEKEKMLALGVYPDASLINATEKRSDARNVTKS